MYKTLYSYSMPKSYHSIPQPKVFPQDIECIIHSQQTQHGSLYISNVEAASNINTLKKLQVGAVLSCAKGHELKHPKTVIADYKYIPAVDHQSCDISIYFDEAADFITRALQKTNLVVHCIAGVSRSVSMVIAYLIREHNMSFDEAHRMVKSKRKIIHPNDGFIQQLRTYQAKIQRKKGSKSVDLAARSSFSVSTVLERQPATPTKTQQNASKAQEDAYSPMLQRHKSIDITGKVGSKAVKKDYNYSSKFDSYWKEPATSYENKYNQTSPAKNIEMAKTSANFYTPSKQVRDTPSKQVRDVSEKKSSVQMYRSTTPNAKSMYAQNALNLQSKDIMIPQKSTNLESMNTQLNHKIEQIRKKYELERQKLFQKYQTSDRDSNFVSPSKTNPEGQTDSSYKTRYEQLQKKQIAKQADDYLGLRRSNVYDKKYNQNYYQQMSRLKNYDTDIKKELAGYGTNYGIDRYRPHMDSRNNNNRTDYGFSSNRGEYGVSNNRADYGYSYYMLNHRRYP